MDLLWYHQKIFSVLRLTLRLTLCELMIWGTVFIHALPLSLRPFLSLSFSLCVTMELKVFPVLMLSAFLTGVNSGNVLVWPAGGSHFLNMVPVLEALMDRGHRVTVLVPNVALPRDLSQVERFDLIFFNISLSNSELQLLLKDFLQFTLYDMERIGLLQTHVMFYQLCLRKQDLLLPYCEGTLRNPQLMDQLRGAHFDVVLSDPVCPCGDLMAHVLGVPFVYSFRFSIAHTVERLCGASVTPPAYVPGSISSFTDRMSFRQRVLNVLFYWSQDAMAVVLWRKYDQYYSQYLGESCTLTL